jgi:hypothetical protein
MLTRAKRAYSAAPSALRSRAILSDQPRLSSLFAFVKTMRWRNVLIWNKIERKAAEQRGQMEKLPWNSG